MNECLLIVIHSIHVYINFDLISSSRAAWLNPSQVLYVPVLFALPKIDLKKKVFHFKYLMCICVSISKIFKKNVRLCM